MAYLVLARKHRPKTFAEMVGQEHVVQALSNALTSQRLHHAYLFTGTRGVGKTTVSRILAKSLNCQGPDGQGGITATPCGVCQACRDIDAGRFVDYTELDAASNRGVDEVQALLEQAVYKPVQGRFKVFMIDEVHMLTGHAFNAMLKTLEEPPEYLKFVLATTDPQKVPVTVLSRCLQFNLRPMAPETVFEHLTQVLQGESVPAEPQALRLIARSARGSMRDALSLTDQAIAFGNGELAETSVRRMLGSADRGHVFGLVDALSKGDGKTVVEVVEALRQDGLSAASTLEEMTAILQGMAVLQAVPSRAAGAASGDPDAVETARLAAAMPADETQLLYSLCLHGRSELGLAPDEYAGLTMVLLRLLAFKPSSTGTAEKKTLNEPPRPVQSHGPSAALPSSPDGSEHRDQPAATSADLSPEVAPMPERGSADRAEGASRAPSAVSHERRSDQPARQGHRLPVVDSPSRNDGVQCAPSTGEQMQQSDGKVLAMPVRVQPPAGSRDAMREPSIAVAPSSEEGNFWHATVTQMVAAEMVNALARELALQSQLVARDVDQWLLRVERESLNQASCRDKLQAALANLGHEVKIAIEIGPVSDSPARRNRFASDQRQRAAEEAIQGDPEIQSMMRDWDAKIVPGTLRPA
ncbi:DNA polymerase III subunit gamma/tau [Burkholderiales bacterium 8X]|nr:DNA polymerase III subunit gamma/tau [Burkholderiales bacterium 8X]